MQAVPDVDGRPIHTVVVTVDVDALAGGGIRDRHSGAAARCSRVADGLNVRLNGRDGCVRCVALGYDAFEEGTGGGVAVVAADPEHDSALLVHRDVPVRLARERPGVQGRQA